MDNIYAKPGTKIICDNVDKNVALWGGNSDAEGVLEVGKEYTVKYTEVHTWHTKVVLEEFPGMKFNSAHFRDE